MRVTAITDTRIESTTGLQRFTINIRMAAGSPPYAAFIDRGSTGLTLGDIDEMIALLAHARKLMEEAACRD